MDRLEKVFHSAGYLASDSKLPYYNQPVSSQPPLSQQEPDSPATCYYYKTFRHYHLETSIHLGILTLLASYLCWLANTTSGTGQTVAMVFAQFIMTQAISYHIESMYGRAGAGYERIFCQGRSIRPPRSTPLPWKTTIYTNYSRIVISHVYSIAYYMVAMLFTIVLWILGTNANNPIWSSQSLYMATIFFTVVTIGHNLGLLLAVERLWPPRMNGIARLLFGLCIHILGFLACVLYNDTFNTSMLLQESGTTLFVAGSSALAAYAYTTPTVRLRADPTRALALVEKSSLSTSDSVGEKSLYYSDNI